MNNNPATVKSRPSPKTGSLKYSANLARIVASMYNIAKNKIGPKASKISSEGRGQFKIFSTGPDVDLKPTTKSPRPERQRRGGLRHEHIKIFSFFFFFTFFLCGLKACVLRL